MNDFSQSRGTIAWGALLRVLRPAVPAVIGAAALAFLFAAVMPAAWVTTISWNLYLDRLSDLFLPPIGNGGRLGLAFGMAAIAAIVGGLAALIIAQPEAAGLASLRRRIQRVADEADADILPRRRVDQHPDDPPRPPIRAGRDLPAEGLMPQAADRPMDDGKAYDLSFAALAEGAEGGEGELILADLAPDDMLLAGEEPWLQPVEATGPALPDPADNSLGAMVARFEAGLSRRRETPAPQTAAVPVPASAAADVEDEPQVDFALEAALSTLSRMTRQAVG